MWTTQQELTFIDGLGNWREQGSHHRKPLTAGEKVGLLEGYRRGLLLRTEWQEMDREELLAHVEAEISAFRSLNPEKVV